MIKAVVYKSGTGFAKRYAEMFAAKLELPCHTLKEAEKQIEKGADIVYFGWIYANKIKGLKKACKRWNIVCAAAVGMNAPSEAYTKLLTDANKAAFPLFFLRGGLDKSKLRGFDRLMINMLTEELEKEGKPENAEIVQLLKTGGDFVSEGNLAEIIAFSLDKL